MTIIEVLFAILITTVGLFSALAIFPFASAQARRARLNDMFAVNGRSAFHAFDVRGMRRPDRLLAWDPTVAGGNGVPAGGFVGVSPGGTSPSNLQTAESFCIDPRLIGKYLTLVSTGPSTQKHIIDRVPVDLPNGQRLTYAGSFLQTFPYTEPYEDDGNSIWNGEPYADLNSNGVHDPFQQPHPTLGYPQNAAGNRFDTSLMRRLTLRSATGSSFAMTLFQANTIFVSDDDISYDRPEDDKSKPAAQHAMLQAPPNAQTPEDKNAWTKRQSDGQISWIATLVPQFDISGASSDNYTLSIVMIHERADPIVDKMRERVVNGQLLDVTGTGGGEILLAGPDADQLKLKPNDWVMLSGTLYPIPGVPNQPATSISTFQWYRISDCDAEPELDTSTGQPTSGLYTLYATLIGRDWNTSYVALPTFPPGSGAVRVTIVEGARAVYEKTVRLEYGSAF